MPREKKQPFTKGSKAQRVVEYDKLVRDGIPDYLAGIGVTAITHIASRVENRRALLAKFAEEGREMAKLADLPLEEARAAIVNELAYLEELAVAACELLNINRITIEQERLRKRAKRGGFERGVILEKTIEEDLRSI